MAFWFDYENLQPKRKYTFILSLGGEPSGDDAPNASLKMEEYLVKKVKKPGFSVSESKHAFLNHTFYYPGKIEWKEVTFEVVDVISPNTSNTFLKILQESGYRLPKSPVDTGDGTAQTLSKKNSIRALGTPRIHQIDDDGNVVETWKLFGAWVKDVEFGELDYSAEDLMSIAVSLRYDFAECVFKQGTEAAGQVLPGSNR